ncbi:TlpA family protein disulfide reductase [Pleionea sediminis]|uniref:TlpA family protein disulfide reductase n=1 Tax=Pleionea sediminis TaxID=2569479 RepID=UPI0011855AFB|nr:TlpA family protein disulfide reductase [Pleionea sediminis]
MDLKIKVLAVVFAIIVMAVYMQPKNIPSTALPTYEATTQTDSGKRLAGGPCQAEKCLTIYVAPWCPVCKRTAPMINQLVPAAEAKGIEVDMIIGYDEESKLKSYAKNHPFTVLLDTERTFFNLAEVEAVPYFAVTDTDGNVLQELRGGSTNVNFMLEQLGL